MKLEIELVPASSWYKSLYRHYQDSGRDREWKQLKKNLFEKEGELCWICKSTKNPLEAHESWEYNTETKIRRLSEIHHICGMCHKIKHIGLWTATRYGKEQMVKKGLTKKDLIEHFCNVNGCNAKVFNKHEDESYAVQFERGKIEWKLDMSLIGE